VLLHGLMGDATMWLRDGQVASIVEHGYRVILPDFRGSTKLTGVGV
jgi:pimeloyl-ACP methyl ester carboxylesterase